MHVEKSTHPLIKFALEFGPTVVFFFLYMRWKDQSFEVLDNAYSGFIIATLVFIPVLLVSMLLLRALTGKLSRMQIITAVLVVFFGGLTAWFNDERFFKIKTTLVYGLIAALLGIGLLRGRSYLAYVMEDMVPMQQEGWMIFTRRICGIFAILAVANEVVWRNLSTEMWVKIETFGFPLALAIFIMAQFNMLQRYTVDPKK
ncbi:MAG: inner membrane-spanning protein YciB [Pseudoruegeria sp.]